MAPGALTWPQLKPFPTVPFTFPRAIHFSVLAAAMIRVEAPAAAAANGMKETETRATRKAELARLELRCQGTAKVHPMFAYCTQLKRPHLLDRSSKLDDSNNPQQKE